MCINLHFPRFSGNLTKICSAFGWKLCLLYSCIHVFCVTTWIWFTIFIFIQNKLELNCWLVLLEIYKRSVVWKSRSISEKKIYSAKHCSFGLLQLWGIHQQNQQLSFLSNIILKHLLQKHFLGLFLSSSQQDFVFCDVQSTVSCCCKKLLAWNLSDTSLN